MNNGVYRSFLDKKAKGQKMFAVLVDPDKVAPAQLRQFAHEAERAAVDYIFIGGSLVLTDHLDACIYEMKKYSRIPVLLFPGHPSQISDKADALLYLSLISGRNADLLIGQHVISAPAVKKSGVETIPTGYMIIDGGLPTTVSYISNAIPIPSDKADIAFCTALAGEMLGMKLIYMDAGSGAVHPISENMIRRVSENISIPLVIGGGICEPEKAYEDCRAGADIIVVGNAIEQDSSLMQEMAEVIHSIGKIDKVIL